jgi:hydroxypyruvate isomerase
MPKFYASLGFLFTDVTFLDRFAASAKARFLAFEHSVPHDNAAVQVIEILH